MGRDDVPPFLQGMAQFGAQEYGTCLSFEAPGTPFVVDSEARTIRTAAVPYGVVADNGQGRWRFHPGALRYTDPTRIKVFVGHNPSDAVGYVSEVHDAPGLCSVTEKIAHTARGDEVLTLVADKVLDGTSVGVRFSRDDSGDWGVVAAEDGVYDVTRCEWVETSLTPIPAYGDMRVTDVRAESHPASFTPVPQRKDVSAMPDDLTPAAPVVAAPTGPADFVAALESFSAGVAALPEALATALTAAMLPQREASPSAASGITVTREAPVYTLDGAGHSFVRDAWAFKRDGSTDARDRLRKHEAQTADHAAQATRAKFAAVDTGSVPDVIPPGYRPEMYVGQIPRNRPLWNMLSTGTISDSTPFTVPKFVSAVGMVGTHVEGERPTEGTLTMGKITVTPGAKSGKLPLTREILDASNPAIDAIALSAMREAYVAETELHIAAMFEAAAAVDTNHDGVSDAGVYLSQVIGTNEDLVYALRHELALYPFRRFAPASRLALGRNGFTGLVDARDTAGRPLLPLSVGSLPGYGTTSGTFQTVNFEGLPGVPAWALNVTAQDAFLFNSVDVWAWESPLLTFRFEEKAGPENIELALFAYVGSAILRPAGITAVAFTEADES
jgi:HK97 family phage prohead protease/HK97 family phage major capsid protein